MKPLNAQMRSNTQACGAFGDRYATDASGHGGMIVNRRLCRFLSTCLGLALLAAPAPVVLAQSPNDTVLEGDDTAVRLTLNETLKLGLANNLDLVAARYTPQSRAEDVRLQQAPFDPIFQVAGSYRESQSPIVQASSVSSSETTTLAPRYEQSFKFGGRVDVDFFRMNQFDQDAPELLDIIRRPPA